jgi:hypothetical protein
MLRAVGTLCFAALLNMARGEMFDVIEAHKLPPVECTHGCARWSNLSDDGSDINQTAVDLLWRSAAAQAVANRSCAQPGRSPFSDSGTTGGYAGVSIPQLDRILLPARVSTVWFPLRDGKMHTHAQPLHAHWRPLHVLLIRMQKSHTHTQPLHTAHACPHAEIAQAHNITAYCPCLSGCRNCPCAQNRCALPMLAALHNHMQKLHTCTHAHAFVLHTCAPHLHASAHNGHM